MSDFNPNDDLDTQEQADAYLGWCADNFLRLSASPKRTYRTALRCAAWLFIISSAQMHLDDECEDNRDALLEQLVKYQTLGRAIERQTVSFPVEQLIVLRSSLDCWEPVGDWSANLLCAAEMAVAALILIDVHPLVDLWDMQAPDVWALLDAGSRTLNVIASSPRELEYEDFAVRPSEKITALWTWQKAQGIYRHAGAQRPSPN